MPYKTTLQFQDRNMPNINMDSDTISEARSHVRYLIGNYAAIRQVYIHYPDGTKEVYTGDGKLIFTIPPKRGVDNE